MSDLLPIPDASLRLIPQALSPAAARDAFAALRTSIDWRQEEIVLWGKRCRQPRLIAWHGDGDARYRYSGLALTPQPWTPALSALRQQVEALAGARFNSVLLNLYRDGRDHMGWHSDDERELGPQPLIASLSLGARRMFQLRHRQRAELAIQSIELGDGSLLLMDGTTQAHWKHRIRRESRPCGERINLTFRRIDPGLASAAGRARPRSRPRPPAHT
jgi:alkylated DNA repair dioxygenase AlkB